ncbi:MAG: tagaturonate epimerase family protein [Spirochaetaceae bacterium]|jgi:hypothetical protein|nr:tagaturonate epimerase family protein [Spirochaetaceae bacterium]
MNYQHYKVFDKSVNKIDGRDVFMASDGAETTVIVAAEGLGFSGKNAGDGNVIAPLSHENALLLRKLFPFTAPSPVLRKDRSFGLGDRLGIAVFGHIKLFEQYDAYPVFAQQSIRELTLTNRTYEDVLDAATFAVFREGFKRPWGADGDHLKTVKDVEYALSLGFTMITLDCSEHIKSGVTVQNAPPLPPKYAEKYLGKSFDLGEGQSVRFEEGELRQTVAIYGEAITFAIDMYNRFLKDGKYNADFEISIDETNEPTTPLQHYFVARELTDGGVQFATLAPRFCGEFQKGIDYIGDLSQFDQEIKIHAVIARHFGYKLSIHSGSDKFSVFPSIGRETRGIFHVKTAGTNWLEAMRTVAVADPALYRAVHRYALSIFKEATAYYHVTTNLANIPDVSQLKDSDLPSLFDNNDARQLIHITYGLILTKKNPDGTFEFKDALYKLWRDRETVYNDALIRHIGKHLDLLGVKKTAS